MAEKLYIQVLNELKEEIKNFKVDEQFYSERTLANIKGISKLTARKVINLLVEEGYLYKKNNSGSFVKSRALESPISFTFLDENIRYKLIYFKYLYTNLKEDYFSDNTRVERYMFLAYNSNTLMSLEEVYVDGSCEEFTTMLKDMNDLKGNIRVYKNYNIEQDFEAIICPVKFMALLGVKETTPLIRIINKIKDTNGIIQMVVISYLTPNNKKLKIF